ncbi:MAG TPA: glycosyl hydrolase family 28-related protein [Pseudonocardiaceae bacterium]|nr:glycosyl hydrolase family 28-related protein [Pseudonocardiaceae bacterium]
MTRPSRKPRHRLSVILAATAAALGLVLVPAYAQASPGGGHGPSHGGSNGPGGHKPPTGGSLGPNVLVFTPDMPTATIQSTLDTIAAQQVPNQFGTQRYAILFAPGTYGTAADPLKITVGYYTSIAGLGQNPKQVVINGTIDAFNQCENGDQTNCTALVNFWRSVSNLTINVAGTSGCFSGNDMWAVSQAAPMRRVAINGGLTLMDFCDGSPDFASGGFIADSSFSGGTIINGSQQQFIVRNSDIDGWSNGVWNQVFCGDPGAPAQAFGDPAGAGPYTTLDTCPTTEEEPYLYQDSAGRLRVFVPSPQHDSSGTTWANGNTPGSSLPLSSFYVVNAHSTVDTINEALKDGDNLLFTPGVYSVPETIQVTKPDTKIIGLGFPTLVPQHGNVTMNVKDVKGVNLSGLIFDAGARRSPVLLNIGKPGGNAGRADDPVSVDDVFFRIGGASAGTAGTAFVDNSNFSIMDDIWAWRADHGAGAGTFAGDVADTGVIVNGDHVSALGLFVEHFEKYETIWNGQAGSVLFFQNENPYEVPSQAAWMATPTQKGFPAFLVTNKVRTFQGFGMGSYSFFNQGVDIHNAMAFQVPERPGVQLHDLLTVFLNASGGIDSVINGVGAPVNSTSGGPSDVVSFP